MKIDMSSKFISDVTIADMSFLPEQATFATTPVVSQIEDNLFERSGGIIGNFIESGQVWALLIGLVLGYAIRGMTTY